VLDFDAQRYVRELQRHSPLTGDGKLNVRKQCVCARLLIAQAWPPDRGRKVCMRRMRGCLWKIAKVSPLTGVGKLYISIVRPNSSCNTKGVEAGSPHGDGNVEGLHGKPKPIALLSKKVLPRTGVGKLSFVSGNIPLSARCGCRFPVWGRKEDHAVRWCLLRGRVPRCCPLEGSESLHQLQNEKMWNALFQTLSPTRGD